MLLVLCVRRVCCSASVFTGRRKQFGLQQALRQSARQERNRTEQPAIHMDQVDRLSINGLPVESKTPAQARE